MPEKEFEIWIDGTTAIRIHQDTHRGRLASFAVVLVALLEGKWIAVGRFDTSHGIPHQDILGRRGRLLEKVWYDDLPPKDVFGLAIETFQKNHEQIKNDYLSQ
jgi:hypothetical protein